jgi:hypothetical protein
MAVQKILLAKKEATYDTDPTPDETNAILIEEDAESRRYEGNRVERNVRRAELGNKEQINVNPHAAFQFSVEAAAAGGIGDTPPAYGPLLLACGFDETIDATPGSENVTYQHPSDKAALRNADSVAIYDFRPEVSQRQISTGIRGSVALTFDRENFGRFQFSNLLGSYNRPAQASPPAGIDFDSLFNAPLPFTYDNVATLTLDGYAGATTQLNIDWAVQVVRMNVPNQKETRLTDVLPTGQITLMAPDISSENFFTTAESHGGTVSNVILALAVGNSAGEIIKVDSQKVNLANIQETEVEGDLAFQMDLRFIDRPIITFQ